MHRPVTTFDHECGVSEIIGAIMLISVVVIAISVIGVFITSQGMPEKVPALSATISVSGDTITLHHDGGDLLSSSQLNFLVDGNPVSPETFTKNGQPWTTWGIGETLIASGLGETPGVVNVVYSAGSSSAVLSRADFTKGVSGVVTTTSTTATLTTTVTPTTTTTTATPVPQYTITASASNGGTIDPSGAVPVDFGASQTFTMIPNTGYHVADVIVDGVSNGSISSYTFNNVQSDHMISATFAINTYTITASAGTGGTINPSGVVSVNYGAQQTFNIYPASGYHIADVLVDGSSVGELSSYTFNNVQANRTITASFAVNTREQIYYQNFPTNSGWPYDLWTRSKTAVILSTTIRNGSSGYSVRDQRTYYFGRLIDTSGYTDIQVNFQWAHSTSVEANEYSLAQYSVDGSSYTTFQTLTGPTGSPLRFVSYSEFPTTVEDNPNFGLRWGMYSNRNDEYLYVDEVEVTGIPI